MRVDADMVRTAVQVPPDGVRWRVYRWDGPAVSLGRSGAIPPASESLLARARIPVVRRPTGGGILFHGTDVSFAVAAPDGALGLPRGLIAAGRILAVPVLAALRALGYEAKFREGAACRRPVPPLCWLQCSGLDIMVQGRKVAAFAQRRVRGAWFQHGSVLVEPLSRAFRATLELAGVGTAADWSRVDDAVGALRNFGPGGLEAAAEAVAEAAEKAWGASK